MRLASFITGTLTALLLAGCATSEPPDIRERLLEMGLERGETDARIPRYRINGWTPINDDYLIVTAGVNDRYLVEFTTPCFGVSGAFFLGFATPNFSVDNFDRLIARGPGNRQEYCDIEEITTLYDISG